MWHYGAPLDKRGHTDIGQPTGTENNFFSEHNNLEKLETNWWRCPNWTVLLVWHVKCICQKKRQNKHPLGLLPFNTNYFYGDECVFCAVEMDLLTVTYTVFVLQTTTLTCQQSHNIVQKDNHSHYSVSSRTSHTKTTTLTTVSTVAHRTQRQPLTTVSAVAYRTQRQPYSLQCQRSHIAQKDNHTHYSVSGRTSHTKTTTLTTVSAVARRTQRQPHSLQCSRSHNIVQKDNHTHYSVSSRIT